MLVVKHRKNWKNFGDLHEEFERQASKNGKKIYIYGNFLPSNVCQKFPAGQLTIYGFYQTSLHMHPSEPLLHVTVTFPVTI